MDVTRPEADSEYSRASEASGGDPGGPKPAATGASGAVATAILAAGLAGAALLLVAEFTALLSVHSGLPGAAVTRIQAGSHHSYALIPIALLAALLSVTAWRSGNPLALLAVGVLGLVALLIALLGDLPDAQASGLIGSPATHFAIARSSPEIGFYLETLGAVALLITAVAGWLLIGPPRDRRRP